MKEKVSTTKTNEGAIATSTSLVVFMVGFYETNTIEDAEAIHAYLDRQQQRLPEMVEMTFLQKVEYWFSYGAAKLGVHFPWMLNATRDMMY